MRGWAGDAAGTIYGGAAGAERQRRRRTDLDADFAERSGEFVFAAEAAADSEHGRLTVCVEPGVTG